MKNLWSKEDLANFNNSEVFSELEARVIKTIKRADILSQKIAQSTTEQKTKSLEGLADAASKATEAVKNLDTAMNSADDEEVEDSEEAFQPILEELYSMAKLAIEKGDYKLAYKIERTIDEVMEPEVKCE